MLYLIKSWTEGDGPILKIGYAKDVEHRMIAYKTHNPGHELLGIREGDEELEKRFHKYLILYQYKDFSEWFVYSEEIIRIFFEEPDSYFSNPIHIATKLNTQKDWETLKCRQFCIKYPYLSEFFNEYYSYSIESSRLRCLCEFLKGNPDQEEIILKSISTKESFYYRVLGPKRCYAFNYRMHLLEKEYQKQLNNQGISSKNICSLIYETFKEGERYLNSDIKKAIQGIYDHLGLKKTGKASDFEEWFEYKKVSITNPFTKKRENGLEIIKRKY